MIIITAEAVACIYEEHGMDIPEYTAEGIATLANASGDYVYDLVHTWAEAAAEAATEYNGVYTGMVDPFDYCN